MTNEKGCPKFGLRGDNRGPWEADFYGERWLVFEASNRAKVIEGRVIERDD